MSISIELNFILNWFSRFKSLIVLCYSIKSKIDMNFCLLWILKVYGRCYSTNLFGINYYLLSVCSETIKCNLRIRALDRIYFTIDSRLWESDLDRPVLMQLNWVVISVAAMIAVVWVDKFHFYRIENIANASAMNFSIIHKYKIITMII